MGANPSKGDQGLQGERGPRGPRGHPGRNVQSFVMQTVYLIWVLFLQRTTKMYLKMPTKQQSICT